MPERLLKKYQQMRDFSDTPEPSGKETRKKAKQPIFVIQKHAATRLHYDFRLEMEGVLKSWAVPKGPSYDPATKRLAMMTEDHPYDYASFEGVIPAGNYGAGNVIIWDEGTWEFIGPGDDPVKALRQGDLKFKLYGKKMFGEWTLFRIKGRSPKGNEWLLVKHRDQFASDKIDITEVAPKSVVSQRLVEEVDPGRTWQSNRAASGKRAPTVASKLQAAAKTSQKRSPASQTRAASSPTRSSRVKSPRRARPTPRRRPR